MVSEENSEAYKLTPQWERIENADYYEIEFNNMLYSTITGNELLFEGLVPESDYSFKIRAVNQSGSSDWSSFTARTKRNPLEFAIKGIRATSTAPSQGGQGLAKLFNFDEGDMWHSKWGEKVTPFEMVLDLRSINELDKIEYLPRLDGGNGILMKGEVFYAVNKSEWIKAGDFEWKRNSETKTFVFDAQPQARYIKLMVSEGVGNYGSGRELYVFKVEGSESSIPGDINNDGIIDSNDLTSYMNYTGLRRGDGDFDGYVSRGDVNGNGLIDAFDISNVAVELEGGVSKERTEKVAGRLSVKASKKSAETGELIELVVPGTDLVSVNALSFALTYNQQDFEFAGIEAIGTHQMSNMTYDRLHSNGQKALYPTFVNIGRQKILNGTADLFKIRLKARRKATFVPHVSDGILVDKELNQTQF